MFAGDWEGCGMNTRRIYDSIERLHPKRVIETECGHAHRATTVEGPYWAGREDGRPPVPFLHYVEWLAEAIRTQKRDILVMADSEDFSDFGALVTKINSAFDAILPEKSSFEIY